MKTFTFLFLAGLLVINNLFPQAPQESPELKEASALIESAVKLFYDHKYDQALSRAKKGVEIRERLLPRGDRLISTSLIYLADIHLAKRDFGAAKKVLERLLAIQQEQFAADDVSLAPTMDRLALAYYGSKDDRKAEDMITRALSAREKAFGAESARVAESLMMLGQFYRVEKDFERAASAYRRSLLIYGKLSGVTTPEFERASDGFACVASDSKNRALYKELNAIRRQFSPPQIPAEELETRVLNGMAVSLPKPEYPVAARDRRLSGTVVIKVLVDETGKVIKAVDMCQGPPYLSESSIQAALKARFTPTKLSGMPVKVNGVIQYHFVGQ